MGMKSNHSLIYGLIFSIQVLKNPSLKSGNHALLGYGYAAKIEHPRPLVCSQ